MANDNYLVIPLGQDAEIVSYQIEMIHYNPHSGILPVQTKVNNQEISLHYQLGSRLAATDYLQHEESPSPELALFLIKLVDILQDSKNLLLNPAAFLLDFSRVYIELNTGEIALVFLPLEPQKTMQESLISLTKELQQALSLLNEARSEIQQILTYLENDYVNLNELRKFLIQVRLEGPLPLKSTKKKPFQLAQPPKDLLANIGGGAEPQNTKEDVKTIWPNISCKRRPLLFFTLVQVVVIVLLIICSNYLGDSAATYVGFALLLGAINILLLKKLLLAGPGEKAGLSNNGAPLLAIHVNKETAFKLSDIKKQ